MVVDVCLSCAGVWLDEGEASYFTADVGALRAAIERAIEEAWATGNECPRCHGELEAVPVGHQRQLERCNRCAGLWVPASAAGADSIYVPVDVPPLSRRDPGEVPEPAEKILPTPTVPRGLFGSVIDFARDPLGAIAHAVTFGDVVRLKMFHSEMYIVNCPEGVKHVIQDNAQNYSRERNQGARMLKPLIGTGVLTSDGPVWRTRRRVAQKSFAAPKLAMMDADMKDEMLTTLGKWRAAGHGQPVDVYTESLKVAVATTMRSLFGYRVTTEERDQLYQAIIDGQHVAWTNLVLPFHMPRWMPAPLGPLAARRVLSSVNAIAERVVQSRRDKEHRRADYLDGILHHGGPGTSIRDEVVTMMTAAPENMAYTFSMALHLIAQHPAVETRLREEIERVLGRRQPVAEDLEKLTYCLCVLKETLRLYPGAYLYDRWAVHDDVVSGYKIPAGGFVAVSPYAMHRRADLWPEPEKFLPERFADPAAAKSRPRYAFFPFGGGPHKCVGEHFALMQLQLLLPLVLQQFRFRGVPDRPIDFHAMITVRPQSGVWMHLEPVADAAPASHPSVAPPG